MSRPENRQDERRQSYDQVGQVHAPLDEGWDPRSRGEEIIIALSRYTQRLNPSYSIPRLTKIEVVVVIVREGRIDLDTPFARQLGFTADRFGGYLWRYGKYIWISFIISRNKGEGHFSELLKKIEKAGFGIKVPDPSPTMKAILKPKGFRKTIDRQQGPFCHYTVERTVMIKKPSKIIVARIQGREKMRGETRGFEERESNPIILRPLSLGHYKRSRPI